jgi:hypothetical protein
LVLPGGTCVTNTTIYLTNLSPQGAVLVDGAGTIINGNTTGAPVISAFGMRDTTIRDLTIYGSTTNTPSIGLEFGRSNNHLPADSNNFDDLHVFGNFSFAAVDNDDGEMTDFNKNYFSNGYRQPAGFTGDRTSCFTFVEDDQNHWGLSPGLPTDVKASFSGNNIVNSWVAASGGCTPVWIGGSGRHTWTADYIANFIGSGYGVILYDGGNTNRFLHMDVHIETKPTDDFFIEGPITAPSLIGFKYADVLNQATNSVFKLDTNITAATMVGGSIKVGQFLSSPVVFAQPSLWSGNPDVALPGATYWNMTSGFSGTLRVGTATTYYGALAETVVRRSLADGASYSVPISASLVRFTQGSTVSSAIVVLPTGGLTDGHLVQFDNYGGAVSALTFSPAVNGWVNGSGLAAYTGLRIRWDAVLGAWYREQ